VGVVSHGMWGTSPADTGVVRRGFSRQEGTVTFSVVGQRGTGQEWPRGNGRWTPSTDFSPTTHEEGEVFEGGGGGPGAGWGVWWHRRWSAGGEDRGGRVTHRFAAASALQHRPRPLGGPGSVIIQGWGRGKLECGSLTHPCSLSRWQNPGPKHEIIKEILNN